MITPALRSSNPSAGKSHQALLEKRTFQQTLSQCQIRILPYYWVLCVNLENHYEFAVRNAKTLVVHILGSAVRWSVATTVDPTCASILRWSKMMAIFEGKVIVITGAGSGIAKATALGLAKSGATLALADIDSESLSLTLRQCTQSCGN